MMSEAVNPPNPFDQTEHRPWAMPKEPWIMSQRWWDLAFFHWSLPPEKVAPYIPKGLTLDTYDGEAWLGVVPFRMSHVHPRFIPSVPYFSAFLELNVRTYVTTEDSKFGVYFFSLDAENPFAVFGARRFYHLPYFNAKMTLEYEGNTRHYTSQRTHKNARPAVLDVSYRPAGDFYIPAKGSLEYFLVERYCLYANDKRDRLYRGEIQHVPWRIAPAEATFRQNTMSPITLPNTVPLMHYAEAQEVAVWALDRLKHDETV